MARTPSKEHGSDISGSGRASIRADGSPLISKPSSTSGSVAPSLKGTDGQDDSRDDISVAESSKGHRKTEEERLQFFHSQPDCREVEPHRAFCTGCDQWVPLNAARPYVMRPWLVHRRECRRNSHTNKQYVFNSRFPEFLLKFLREGTPQRLSIKKRELLMAVMAMKMSHLPFNLHPRRRGGTRARRNARLTSKETRAPKKFDRMKRCARPARNGCSSETRRAIRSVTGKDIKNDALVRCKSIHMDCVHSQIDNTCSPSSRVATAERKLKLVNDASAKSFSGTSVNCKHCDATIALDGEGDYNLTKWQEHKAACPRSVRFASLVRDVAS